MGSVRLNSWARQNLRDIALHKPRNGAATNEQDSSHVVTNAETKLSGYFQFFSSSAYSVATQLRLHRRARVNSHRFLQHCQAILDDGRHAVRNGTDASRNGLPIHPLRIISKIEVAAGD